MCNKRVQNSPFIAAETSFPVHLGKSNDRLNLRVQTTLSSIAGQHALPAHRCHQTN
jgi:hypothetical protein